MLVRSLVTRQATTLFALSANNAPNMNLSRKMDNNDQCSGTRGCRGWSAPRPRHLRYSIIPAACLRVSRWVGFFRSSVCRSVHLFICSSVHLLICLFNLFIYLLFISCIYLVPCPCRPSPDRTPARPHAAAVDHGFCGLNGSLTPSKSPKSCAYRVLRLLHCYRYCYYTAAAFTHLSIHSFHLPLQEQQPSSISPPLPSSLPSLVVWSGPTLFVPSCLHFTSVPHVNPLSLSPLSVTLPSPTRAPLNSRSVASHIHSPNPNPWTLSQGLLSQPLPAPSPRPRLRRHILTRD